MQDKHPVNWKAAALPLAVVTAALAVGINYFVGGTDKDAAAPPGSAAGFKFHSAPQYAPGSQIMRKQQPRAGSSIDMFREANRSYSADTAAPEKPAAKAAARSGTRAELQGFTSQVRGAINFNPTAKAAAGAQGLSGRNIINPVLKQSAGGRQAQGSAVQTRLAGGGGQAKLAPTLASRQSTFSTGRPARPPAPGGASGLMNTRGAPVHAGETAGAQYADPLGLPVALANSGGAGISAGVQLQPATGSASSGMGGAAGGGSVSGSGAATVNPVATGACPAVACSGAYPLKDSDNRCYNWTGGSCRQQCMYEDGTNCLQPSSSDGECFCSYPIDFSPPYREACIGNPKKVFQPGITACVASGESGGSVPAASLGDGFPDLSPGSGDSGIGSGLWVPPGTTNRLVADGSSSRMSMSYVPGCLNGQHATSSSSGCALKDNYNGFRLGGGKTLMVRYRTPATVEDGKGIKVGAWNGGNVGVGMSIWLSEDPTSTYSSASQCCRAAESGTPAIITASRGSITSSRTAWGKTMQVTNNYCALRPNTLYYFGIKFDEVVSGAAARFQIDEMFSPFLP